ncbi:MAG: HNH endonuclease [Treponema sp.]|jgi:hypothetical protein|nr:HNH endonuclease [Treponema sp.]
MEKRKRAPYHTYTPEQIEFLKEKVPGRRYAEVAALFNEHFCLKLTERQIEGVVAKLGLNGHTPKKLKGCRSENSIKAQFKPGCLHPLYKPLGTEKKRDGYTMIKIAEPNVWDYKHRQLWEAANGPVPKGHMVIFADGNISNLELNNLLLVSKREFGVMNLMRLRFSDKDLTKTGKLVADLYMLARKRKGELKDRKKPRAPDKERKQWTN